MIQSNSDISSLKSNSRSKSDSGNTSPTEISSTSTDEGIYQEVDDQSINDNEETLVLCHQTDKMSKMDREPDQIVLPPPPPPLPPPDFMKTITNPMLKSNTIDKTDFSNNTDADQGAKRSSSAYVPRFIKNSQNSNTRKTLPTNAPLFIPPQFNTPPTSNSNIKPSEYLKRIATKTVSDHGHSSNYDYLHCSNKTDYFQELRMQRSVSENHLLASIERYEAESSDIDSNVNKDGDGDRTSSTQNVVKNFHVKTDDVFGLRNSVIQKSDSSSDIGDSCAVSLAKTEVTRSLSSMTASNSISSASMTSKFACSNTITMTITNDQLKNVMLKPLMRKNPSQEERNDPTATSNKNDLIEELKMAKNLDGIKKAKESNRNLNEVIFDTDQV